MSFDRAIVRQAATELAEEQREFMRLIYLYPHEYGIVFTIDIENGESYVAYRRTGGRRIEFVDPRASYQEAKSDMDRWYAEDVKVARKDGAA